MNMQALMKQAQKMQKDMLTAKNEIDNSEFVGESSLVQVTMKGTKKITKVKINLEDNLELEDIEMLEDMVMVAVNEASEKVDKATEQKMGKFGNSLPGMF